MSEFEISNRRVSRSIRDQAGRTIAAVNVMEYPPRASTQTKLKRYLPLWKDTARQIEMALNASQPALVALTGQRAAESH
jgi:DNA-binding IclR family transcriptional regulator